MSCTQHVLGSCLLIHSDSIGYLVLLHKLFHKLAPWNNEYLLSYTGSGVRNPGFAYLKDCGSGFPWSDSPTISDWSSTKRFGEYVCGTNPPTACVSRHRLCVQLAQAQPVSQAKNDLFTLKHLKKLKEVYCFTTWKTL